MSITPLNRKTIKLISTTQVITSVWSVVKELIENSLDAGAESIEVNLVNNGLHLIEVSDDGSGISKADAPFMALLSHTSKLKDVKDLESLRSYGFRGVALSSICAVAEVTVWTKLKDDEIATIYTLDSNGHIINSEPSHRNCGTTIQVRNLFKNLPVRKQILSDTKKINHDISNVEYLIKGFSICKPGVRFRFSVNSQVVFMKPPVINFREAFAIVFSRKVLNNLETLNDDMLKMSINLIIPKKDIEDLKYVCKSMESYTFINDRPIQYRSLEKMINKRIIEFFSVKNLNIKKSVFCVIINVESDGVDVNLEPNKYKVLLHHEDEVFKNIENMLIKYYGLGKPEDTEKETPTSDLEVTKDNESISEFEEISQPVPKKRKLTVDIDVVEISKAAVSSEKKIIIQDDEENQDSKNINNFLCNVNPPVLSESDSDMENENFSNNRSSLTLMETILENEVTIDCQQDCNKVKEHKNNEMTSQLPVVDLGEDFDISDFINIKSATKCTIKVENDKESEESVTSYHMETNSDMPEIGSDAWSRGHVTGGGGVNVVVPTKVGSISEKKETQKKQQTLTSAFRLFFNDNISLLNKEKPYLSKPQMAKEISDRWRNQLSSEERGYYKDLASEYTNVSQVAATKTLRSQNQMENVDVDANKKKLLRYLENMKRINQQENKGKILMKKTITNWSINIEDVTNNFWNKKKHKKVTDKYSIIGSLENKKFFIGKHENYLWALNASSLLKKSNAKMNDKVKINAEVLESLLKPNISDNADSSLTMYKIHSL